MYCVNCGNKLKKEKFCPKCGKNVKEPMPTPVVQEPMPVYDNSKSKKTGITIALVYALVVLLAFVAFIGLTLFIVFLVVGRVQEREFIDLSGYNIPTVYKVLDDKRYVCSINSTYGVYDKTVIVDYCNHLSSSDVSEYINYLVQKEGFVYNENNNGFLNKVDGPYKYTITIDSNDVITFKSERDAL